MAHAVFVLEVGGLTGQVSIEERAQLGDVLGVDVPEPVVHALDRGTRPGRPIISFQRSEA